VTGNGPDHDQQAEEWGEQGPAHLFLGVQFTRPTSSAVSEG
jgi:hypothetical protein